MPGVRAHPHVCGEHDWGASVDGEPPGSSPRMRGTPLCVLSHGEPSGLIPTYAGNTGRVASVACCARAHPHVCGEHLEARELAAMFLGSSPRMRGTPASAGVGDLPYGLIPTYAGNTSERGGWGFALWAHPHVCGEHNNPRLEGCALRGSSPRMRGTPESTQKDR